MHGETSIRIHLIYNMIISFILLIHATRTCRLEGFTALPSARSFPENPAALLVSPLRAGNMGEVISCMERTGTQLLRAGNRDVFSVAVQAERSRPGAHSPRRIPDKSRCPGRLPQSPIVPKPRVTKTARAPKEKDYTTSEAQSSPLSSSRAGRAIKTSSASDKEDP